jgi:hypothetical protein
MKAREYLKLSVKERRELMDAKLHAAEKKGGMLSEKDRLKIMKSLNPYKEYTFEVTNSKEEFEKMITLKIDSKISSFALSYSYSSSNSIKLTLPS